MNIRKGIVFAWITLMILASLGLMSTGNSTAQSSNPYVVAESVTWYAPNSTQQVSPGSSYLPLFVTLSVTEAGTENYENFSIGLGASGYFSYSYVNGAKTGVIDYENLTFPTSATAVTRTITLEQLVNISSDAQKGVYQLSVNLKTNLTGGSETIPFQAGVLATPSITLVNSFTDPPVIYQDEKYISLTLVLANSGLGAYQNFNVSVSSPYFQILTGTYHIPYFQSGAIENLTFLISAHDVTGDAPINVTYGQATSQIALYLHSHGSLSVSSVIPTLQPGSSSDVEQFNITNTGNVAMYDIQIHLASPSVISIHVSSSNPLGELTANNVTVGQLNPGQEITITFMVDVSSSASSISYPAQLIILWHTNDSQEQFMQVYNFAENVSPTTLQQIQNSLTFTPLNMVILGVIVVLIIALIAVSAHSRRLKKKSERRSGTDKPPSLEHKEIPEKKEIR